MLRFIITVSDDGEMMFASSLAMCMVHCWWTGVRCLLQSQPLQPTARPRAPASQPRPLTAPPRHQQGPPAAACPTGRPGRPGTAQCLPRSGVMSAGARPPWDLRVRQVGDAATGRARARAAQKGAVHGTCSMASGTVCASSGAHTGVAFTRGS